jgi:hypothetical protein
VYPPARHAAFDIEPTATWDLQLSHLHCKIALRLRNPAKGALNILTYLPDTIKNQLTVIN